MNGIWVIIYGIWENEWSMSACDRRCGRYTHGILDIPLRYWIYPWDIGYTHGILDINVTDTISWRGHHDRVMQLNWLYFCGICQVIPLKVWPNTALGCNHQSIWSICMLSYSLQVQLLWHPMYYPGRMKARVSPVQWSKPHSILAPTQDSNPGGRIQNHKRYTTLPLRIPMRYGIYPWNIGYAHGHFGYTHEILDIPMEY